MKLHLLIGFLTLIVASCDPNNKKLSLVNNTNKVLYYRVRLDSMIFEKMYLYEAMPYDTVMPNLVMGSGDGVWEYRINNKSPDSSLYIFIFQSEAVDQNMYIGEDFEQKGFNVETLDRLNWIITYPDDFIINR